MKGQLHNMQMKAAHGRAQESIYRQRFVSHLDSNKVDAGEISWIILISYFCHSCNNSVLKDNLEKVYQFIS